MLLFPYLLQDRHTKSVYRLIGDEKTNSNKNSIKKNVNDNEEDQTELQLEEDSDYPTF